MRLICYTDGSAHPNPGPGGFGVVAVDDDGIAEAISRECAETTNNREELKAILYTMARYGEKFNLDREPVVFSDSAYAVNTLNEWMFSWAKNGWLKYDGKVPENLDLIQEYYDWYQQGYRIDLRKIKGHNGHYYNELADKLATGTMTVEEVLNLDGEYN